MKPIKLDKIPDDPCIDCVVQACCSLICKAKHDQVNWVRSKFYGHQLHDRYRYRYKKDKNAKLIRDLYLKNRKFDDCNPYYVAAHFKK